MLPVDRTTQGTMSHLHPSAAVETVVVVVTAVRRGRHCLAPPLLIAVSVVGSTAFLVHARRITKRIIEWREMAIATAPRVVMMPRVTAAGVGDREIRRKNKVGMEEEEE